MSRSAIRSRRVRGILMLGAVSFAMTACGSDDDAGDEVLGDEGAPVGVDPEDLRLAEAITASLDADDADGFGEVFDTTCMGTEIVAALGGHARADSEYGITPASVADSGQLLDTIALSPDDAEKVVAGYESCGDFEELLTLSFVSSGATEEQAACVVDALPDGIMSDALVDDFQTPGDAGYADAGSALDLALAEAAAGCVDS